jgi:hypothetical protein
MAVRREQIHSRNQSAYQDLLYMLRNHEQFVPGNTLRALCCHLERRWHILFGQPAELPTSALVMDQLQQAGLLGEFARLLKSRKSLPGIG